MNNKTLLTCKKKKLSAPDKKTEKKLKDKKKVKKQKV